MTSTERIAAAFGVTSSKKSEFDSLAGYSFFAVIVGSSWALVGNRLFDDGREHFIIVRKDGKTIAVGFIYSASDPSDNNTELAITEYPELKRAETELDRPSYLRNVLQTYLDVRNNIVITETEYPPEWIH